MILPEHVIDGLYQFCTTGLINAAGVNPNVFQAILNLLLASHTDLPELRVLVAPGWRFPVFGPEFIVFPRMRKNSVRGTSLSKNSSKALVLPGEGAIFSSSSQADKGSGTRS